MSDAWTRLGVPYDADQATVRRAYATLVRQYRPDSHPQEFSEIRQAYELALKYAAEEPQSQPAAPAPVLQEDAGPGFADTLPQQLEPLAETLSPRPPAALRTPAPTPQRLPEAEPQPDPAHAALSALVRCFLEQGELAAAQLMQRQLAELARQPVDVRLDFEALLLRSLVNDEAPPLALVFEANRVWRWNERLQDVAQLFGDQAAVRLQWLVEMACQSTFAQHFSANAWVRRTFQPAAKAPWFGMLGTLRAATGLESHWTELCERAGAARLRSALNEAALQRVRGRVIYSVDLLFALLLGWWGWAVSADAAKAQSWLQPAAALGATLLALPLPLLWRELQASRVGRWLGVAKRVLSKLGVVGNSLLFGVLLIAAVIAADIQGALPAVRLGGKFILGAYIAGAAIVGAAIVWHLLAFVELITLLLPFRLQSATDLHAFAQVRDSAQPWSVPGRREKLRMAPTVVAAALARRARGRVKGWKGGLLSMLDPLKPVLFVVFAVLGLVFWAAR